MWVQVQTPPVPRPIWGVNWSDPDRLLVLTGGGLLEITLAPTVGLCTLASAEDLRRVFDPDHDCTLAWAGRRYSIDGPYCGGPGRISPAGERLDLHPGLSDTIAVLDADGAVVRQVLATFRLSEERWAVADFTADYRYIVAFDADELRVFRPEGKAEPSGATERRGI
jgi:hypothetical protein